MSQRRTSNDCCSILYGARSRLSTATSSMPSEAPQLDSRASSRFQPREGNRWSAATAQRLGRADVYRLSVHSHGQPKTPFLRKVLRKHAPLGHLRLRVRSAAEDGVAGLSQKLAWAALSRFADFGAIGEQLNENRPGSHNLPIHRRALDRPAP